MGRNKPGTPYELSMRQIDCLRLLAHGERAKDIARTLGISPKTVWNYLTSAYLQMAAKSGPHAVFMAASAGLIGAPAFERQKGSGS